MRRVVLYLALKSNQISLGLLDLSVKLFQSIPLVNVWRGRNRLHVLLEMITMVGASFLLLTTFHVVPYAGFCERPDDVCSCSFTKSLPAVAEYCGTDATSYEANAAVVDNVTAVLQQCVKCTEDVRECGAILI